MLMLADGVENDHHATLVPQDPVDEQIAADPARTDEFTRSGYGRKSDPGAQVAGAAPVVMVDAERDRDHGVIAPQRTKDLSERPEAKLGKAHQGPRQSAAARMHIATLYRGRLGPARVRRLHVRCAEAFSCYATENVTSVLIIRSRC